MMTAHIVLLELEASTVPVRQVASYGDKLIHARSCIRYNDPISRDLDHDLIFSPTYPNINTSHW